MYEIPMGGYTESDLLFGKYFKAVNKFGKIVLASAFMLIYQTVETCNGTLPVRDYCLLKLKWSSSYFSKIFNAPEREILANEPSSDGFLCDITLLFKIIMQVLGNLAEPIKKELRELKNLRNTVCHEDLEMDEADLEQRVNKFKGLCKIILTNTGIVIGNDLTDTINEVESGLQALLDDKLETSDIESHMKALETFRQEKQSRMISEGRKELMKIYSKTKILNPCSWLSDSNFSDFTVDNIFTTLKIAENGANILMNNILNVTSLKERFVPRVVIVKGVMGSGKTSLYRYLLNEWCKRSSKVIGLTVVDIVIGIELRTVSCGSLVQYLREQLLKNTSRQFSESDIIPILQELNVLFAIDGIDEATNQGKALVREIVNKFTDNHIVITTRPEFTLEVMQMAEDHIVLQVEGFDDESQKKFVEKVFSIKYTDTECREDEARKFLSYKSIVHNSLSNHLTLPLTLALLLVLWCDDSLKVSAVSTTTRLYHMIYDMSQQKLISRLESCGAGHVVSLSRKIRRWLRELGHIAWIMMCEEMLNLNQEHADHLMDLCDKEGLDPIQTMSTFLKCEVKESLTGIMYHFSFQHCSQLEFLAAMYISEELCILESISSFTEGMNCSKFQELIVYVTGLLKIHGKLTTSLASLMKNTLIHCMGVHANDPAVWWRLLVEAEKDTAMSQIVGSIINQTELWVINSWDPPEMTETKVNLLRETGAAPSEIIIHVMYTTSFKQLSEVQDIVRLIGERGKSRVKLYIDHQFHTAGDQELVDTHVVPLLKVNNLLEFKGHAGESFTSELVGATKMQSLFIRITSLKALFNLHVSTRKHRHWKTKVMPNRKWALKYMELFLDISTDVKSSEIPYIHFNGNLVVKLAGIADSDALWAGEVLKRLNKRYTSVILQASHLTLAGMKQLLYAADGVTIKIIRVLSDYSATQKEVQSFAVKYGVKIGWGIS